MQKGYKSKIQNVSGNLKKLSVISTTQDRDLNFGTELVAMNLQLYANFQTF